MGDRPQLTARTIRSIWWGYAHIVAYSLVNSALLLTNRVYSSDRAWSRWPLFLWSAVLLAHAVLILVFANREDRDREKRPQLGANGMI